MLMNETSRRGEASVCPIACSFVILNGQFCTFTQITAPEKLHSALVYLLSGQCGSLYFWDYTEDKKSAWSIRRPVGALTQVSWELLSVVAVFNNQHHNWKASYCSYAAPFWARFQEFLYFLSINQFGQSRRSAHPAGLSAQECVKQLLMEASAFSSLPQRLFLSSLSFDCFIHNSLRLVQWLFQASFLTRRLHMTAPEGSGTEYTFAFPVSPAEMQIWCLPRGCCWSAHRCEPHFIDFLSVLSVLWHSFVSTPFEAAYMLYVSTYAKPFFIISGVTNVFICNESQHFFHSLLAFNFFLSLLEYYGPL